MRIYMQTTKGIAWSDIQGCSKALFGVDYVAGPDGQNRNGQEQFTAPESTFQMGPDATEVQTDTAWLFTQRVLVS